MRFILCSALTALSFDMAVAEPLTVKQNAETNYAVIDTSGQNNDVTIKQKGKLNGIAAAQRSDTNSINATQRGWSNTVVIYQNGTIDTSVVAQSGPPRSDITSLPTTYLLQKKDDTYLSYFTSGGFSMVTLTDPNNTITSRFGRTR